MKAFYGKVKKRFIIAFLIGLKEVDSNERND